MGQRRPPPWRLGRSWLGAHRRQFARTAPIPPAGSQRSLSERRKDGWAIGTKVFVGNLNFETTEQELTELFAQAGEVVSVSIPTDRMSGRPRGFAFVEFATAEASAAAITKFEGFMQGGRNLRVNEANDKPEGGRGFGRPFGADAPGRRPFRSKGSRRNIRGRKRSIW